MRIDFVITELFVGGAEKCLTEIAVALAEGGDQIRVFSLASLPDGDQRLLVDRMHRSGIAVHGLNAESIWNYPRAWRALRGRLEESPPQLVQTFLHHANVLGMHAATAAGISVTVAGVRVAQPRPLRSQIERVALGRAHRVVCVSNAVRSFAMANLGCAAEKTVVISNGVDIERFSMATPIEWSALGWPNDADVSLFVGRLDSQKGIDLLQQQIARIAPEATKRKLLLVGDGPLRQPLQQWCDQMGPARVQLLPWQSDIAPLLKACRLLVLPSRYEGMPNVVMEAMAAGKPVVCSLVEGSEELLQQDAQGQGFAPGDGTNMARLIEQLAADRSRCERLGNENQLRMKNHFSLDRMVDAYRQQYAMLLESQTT